MRTLKRDLRGLYALVLVLTAVVACSAVRAEPSEPTLASATARELWRKGSDQVLAGNFAAAATTLEQVQTLEPGHKEVSDALGWMREATALEESRERLRSKTYVYYVEQAKKYSREAKDSPPIDSAAIKEKKEKKEAMAGREKDSPRPRVVSADAELEHDAGNEEGSRDVDVLAGSKKDGEERKDRGFKWSKALVSSQAAMLNAKDEDSFREEPWLPEIVENVLVEIERHKSEKEWRDALFLYDVLSKLFPKNKDYQTGFTYCSKRAHLDFVYGPKSNWRSDLRDVSASAIWQVLDRIEDDYVQEADFRQLCTSGLEHLVILAEAESITESFPTLGDKDLVTNFVTRVKGIIKNRVQGKGAFGPRQVRAVFSKVLEANTEGLRLPEQVLVDEFVSGMLEHLDEFTSVIWPSEVDDFNKHTRGDFVGVGIQITQDIGKHVRVESPLEDSPAYKAGIKPGDFITEVDGKSTLDMTTNQAVQTITGEPGTTVRLTIKDPVTEESRVIPLKREHIKIRTVRGYQRNEKKSTGWDYVVDPTTKIGYVRVSGFMDKTVEDLEDALKQMRKDGVRGLILDLRFNPGGLLTSAVHMCELFMKKGDPVVMTKGRSRQQNMEINSKSDDNYHDLPLVVLVNEYSASASEIVAGALSGLKEACIVGTRSFGKGSVQNLIPISDNQAYLKLTTAKYHVPDSDRLEDPWYCLHRDKNSETWGVEPHIGVKVIPQELGKILRLRREKDVLKGKDQSAIPKDVLERRPTSEPAEALPEDEDPTTDPQLVAAVNIMRIKLLSNQPWALAPRANPALSRVDSNRKATKKEGTADER
ncbi:MAG: S41 family peptidase [Planctomycetota bacterium]